MGMNITAHSLRSADGPVGRDILARTDGIPEGEGQLRPISAATPRV